MSDTDGVTEVLRQAFVSATLTNAGVSADTATMALAEMPVELTAAGKMDVTGYALGMALTMVVFFAVYFYGYGVAMSVASEKTSRVMETLLVSASPTRILLGKCVGMGLLGLVQLSLFLLAGGLGYAWLVPDGFSIMGAPLALSSFTVGSALLVLVYFLLGYALYALINSICGATVSRTEDLNSAMMPAVLVSIVSFYAAYMMLFLDDSPLRRAVGLIPFTSPFLMPFRLLNETVPAVEIVVSIVLLIAAIVAVAALSARIYAASVLHYGTRLKLGELFRRRA